MYWGVVEMESSRCVNAATLPYLVKAFLTNSFVITMTVITDLQKQKTHRIYHFPVTIYLLGFVNC